MYIIIHTLIYRLFSLSLSLYIVNTFLHIFSIHTYIKNTQTVLLKFLYQTFLRMSKTLATCPRLNGYPYPWHGVVPPSQDVVAKLVDTFWVFFFFFVCVGGGGGKADFNKRDLGFKFPTPNYQIFKMLLPQFLPLITNTSSRPMNMPTYDIKKL